MRRHGVLAVQHPPLSLQQPHFLGGILSPPLLILSMENASRPGTSSQEYMGQMLFPWGLGPRLSHRAISPVPPPIGHIEETEVTNAGEWT